MKIAALQTDIVWESPDENFRRLRPRLDAARQAGAQLLVLPEMFACGFSMNTDGIAETMDGPTLTYLRQEATRLGCWICGSLPLREPPAASKPANAFCFAGPDGQLHRYDKIHPFSYAGEHERYTAGRAAISITLEGVRITPFVCYDLRFADLFWSKATATDCYVVVANWPTKRSHHWAALLRARAIENQAWVVGVNRVGDGGGLSYDGKSAIIDPQGNEIVRASHDETCLIADVTAARVEETRARFPFLQDRVRPSQDDARDDRKISK